MTFHHLALRLLCAVLMVAIFIGLDAGRRTEITAPARSLWPSAGTTTHQESSAAPRQRNNALVLTGHGPIPMPVNTPAAHASSLLPMPSGHAAVVMAFWFAGTRESAADVHIAAAQFERATQQWSAARWVVNRQTLSQALGFGVRRLGNPVAWLDTQGRIHLFVVATGLGGWAAGRIVHLRQSHPNQNFDTLSFTVVRMLPLSWLWNTSFLVRTAPLTLQDGGMVLPVHFELGLKYPVALRFDAQGAFKGMVRISRRRYLLQPTLLMQSESHWLALMRDQRPAGKVALAQTMDGGQSWIDLPDLTLHNPDSSVASLAVAPGRLLLAHNSSPDSRKVLDLSQSQEGQHWLLAQSLARGVGTAEYSYPALAWADDSLWVSYTSERQHIAWQRFSLSASAKP